MTCARTNSGARCAHLLAWVILCLAPPLQAADTAPPSPEAEFNRARTAWQKEPRNPETAWQFARACFDLGEAATNKTQRAQAAEQGIAACRKALETATNSTPLRYYLALNLGELAQTRGLSALRLVSQMEQELLLAIEIDPRFDHAGPERTLGLLYRDAPSFGSVGSKTKARVHLLRAVELDPDYPDNRIQLIEAYLSWNERNSARHELQALEESLPKAKAELKGPQWEQSWRTWDSDLQRIKKRLQDQQKLESPRH